MEIFSLVDMDAFFTSVEESINPSLKSKPLAVGTRVVACANYIARKYGISSAMPTFKAKELCKRLVVLSGNHRVYRNVSKRVKNFLKQFSPYVYQASIDEFYLDLTSICKNFEEAEVLSYEISKSLYNKFHITASIGVAPTLIASKIASEVDKPNGIKIIYPQNMKNFILSTKVKKFPGIGKSTLKKLLQLNIHYARDFENCSISSLKTSFTNNQIYYLKLLLSANDGASFIQRESKTKSISRSVSFKEPIKSKKETLNLLMYFLEKMLRSLRSDDLLTNTIEISLRKTDYTWKSKRKSLKIHTRSSKVIYNIIEYLLDEYIFPMKVKGIRLKLDNLKKSNNFPILFKDETSKIDEVFKYIKPLENKYGKELLKTGLSYYYSSLFKTS